MLTERGAHARRLADRDRPLGRLRRVAERPGRSRQYRRPHGGDAGAAVSQGRAGTRRRRSRRAHGAARHSSPTSFACVPNDQRADQHDIRCANPACDFTRDRPLPVLTVDEVIYRRLPAFVIATVDKFAGLPLGRRGRRVLRPCRPLRREPASMAPAEPRDGKPLFNDDVLDPPDLIIQDELHLISGPLGTVAALYETAIDRLCTRTFGGARVRPKIVASTATVRRAERQIEALFDRAETQVFPPPGIERTDSWFAKTVPPSESPARLYRGPCRPGSGTEARVPPRINDLDGCRQRNLRGQRRSGRCRESGRPLHDGALLLQCAARTRRRSPHRRGRGARPPAPATAASAGASIPRTACSLTGRSADPLELTSRVSTDEVALAKARLERLFRGDRQARVDVALATNMISVGLDITRLGLMVVQGQPKTAAEYIQATSRVGRAVDKPGLVVAVLNLHKPRDRTHYESFRLFHRTFYRVSRGDERHALGSPGTGSLPCGRRGRCCSPPAPGIDAGACCRPAARRSRVIAVR